MKKNELILLLAVSAIFFSSCKPRGETESVGAILYRAKERYNNTVRVSSVVREDGEIKGKLDSVSSGLEEMLREIENPKLCSDRAGGVSETLDSLTQSAGYPSRASLREVSGALKNLDCSKGVNGSAARLEVARIYDLLSSELEGAAFSVK